MFFPVNFGTSENGFPWVYFRAKSCGGEFRVKFTSKLKK